MINNELKERMEALINSREDWTVDELNQELEKIVNEMNKKPLDNFEGFSPADMHYILYTPFHEKCPIGINTDISKDFLLQHSPLLKLAVYIMEKISAEGPMPLTSKGNLKVSFIKELYNLGIYYGYDRDSFEKRPYQGNWDFLKVVMLTCIIAGVLKKIKGIAFIENDKIIFTGYPEYKKDLNNSSLIKDFSLIDTDFYMPKISDAANNYYIDNRLKKLSETKKRMINIS